MDHWEILRKSAEAKKLSILFNIKDKKHYNCSYLIPNIIINPL